MTKIILTRHGRVEGIEPERFRGRTELPLTELGRAQAKAVAARIAKAWNADLGLHRRAPMGRRVLRGGIEPSVPTAPGVAEQRNRRVEITWR
jgi:phosphoserine phosphatase